MEEEGSHSSLDIRLLERGMCGSLAGDWELLDHSAWHWEVLERGDADCCVDKYMDGGVLGANTPA